MVNKKRRVGRLSKASGFKQPSQLIFFDTETYNNYKPELGNEQLLRLGVATYVFLNKHQEVERSETIVFYDADTLIDFITSYVTSKKAVYIFAHNMAFDMMVTSLPNNFRCRGIDIKPYIRNQMVFIWSVDYNGGSMKFINTGNYTPYPLAKVAKDLGMKKLKVDFNTKDEDLLIEYCKMDVLIIQELVIRLISFLHENNLGSFKLTLASQALYSYRKRFNSCLPYTHTNESILELEHRAYKGGRTEAFRLGEFTNDRYFYTDINSMYPFVMRGNTMPRRMIRELSNTDILEIEKLSVERYILAECTLKTPLNFLGVLYNPAKYNITNSDNPPRGSKLIFPTGVFKEVLHHDELVYALKMGFIEKVHRAVIYEKGDLFTEYIDFFTEMKVRATVDNNPTYRLMAKLFLNSLYGKFAQQYKWFEKLTNEIDPLYQADIVYNIDDDKIHSEFMWFGEKWGNFTKGWVNHSIPVIAGAVTARARMLLWDYITEVGQENLYYTDTDSLITNWDGFDYVEPFIHPTTLGKLKLEKTTHNMKIYGCKDYRFGHERILKGVPKNAVEIEPHTFIYDQFEGAGQWQRRDMTAPPLIYPTIKHKRSQYDKGVVHPSGIIEPYEFMIMSS